VGDLLLPSWGSIRSAAVVTPPVGLKANQRMIDASTRRRIARRRRSIGGRGVRLGQMMIVVRKAANQGESLSAHRALVGDDDVRVVV